MSNSPFKIKHRHGDCYATWYARKKARSLVGHFGFVPSDQDDLFQTLIVKLLERWPQFDPGHIKPGRFISWAIKLGVKDLIRDQRQRQKFEPTESIPVEPAAADETFGDVTGCHAADPSVATSLKLDVATILARLPPDIRHIAELLQSNTLAEIERQTGKSRQSLRSAAQKIRAAFERAGYGAD